MNTSLFPNAEEMSDFDRWETSPPGMDEAEIVWWQQFSDVEEEYCWVQTSPIQRFLRGHYIKKIIGAIAPQNRVLEFGCGTGWLSILLADYGAAQVYGVDFSSEQIRRAEEATRKKGLTGRVRFCLLEDSLADLNNLLPDGRFDALILHGVLHHLTKEEIRLVLATFCTDLAKENAKVFILEPVLYDYDANDPDQRKVNHQIDRWINLPLRGQRAGLRRRSSQEKTIQEKLDRRIVGVYPRGPSPKEMPFRPGELEQLLDSFVYFRTSTPVLLFSFLAAKNLLLTRVSYPLLGRLTMWPYLWLARRIERKILSDRQLSCGYSVFELKECEVKRER